MGLGCFATPSAYICIKHAHAYMPTNIVLKHNQTKPNMLIIFNSTLHSKHGKTQQNKIKQSKTYFYACITNKSN